MKKTNILLFSESKVFKFRLQDLLIATRKWFLEEDDSIPPGLGLEFFKWGWDETNQYSKLFFEVFAVRQTAVLCVYNSMGIIDDTIWPDYVEVCTRWLYYTVLEFISDNLAFGYLINLETDQDLYHQQVKAVTLFNDVFIAKLKGTPSTTTELLTPIRTEFNFLSKRTHLHINTDRFIKIIKLFLASLSTKHTLTDFFDDYWTLLVANIDSFFKSSELVQGHELSDYLIRRQQLRYEGINQLMRNNKSLTRLELLQVRSPEIMASSSLCYFFIYIANKSNIAEKLAEAHRLGKIQPLVEKVDMLVRITNDIGAFATTDEQSINKIFSILKKHHYEQPTQPSTILTLFESLGNQPKQLLDIIARILRDITLGEDNIVRDYNSNLSEKSVLEKLEFMQQAVLEFSSIYKKLKEEFNNDLLALTDIMGDPLYSNFSERFVLFHEELYQNDFYTLEGDYGV